MSLQTIIGWAEKELGRVMLLACRVGRRAADLMHCYKMRIAQPRQCTAGSRS